LQLVAATCALDAQIKLWDIESGKLIRDIDATPGKILPWTIEFYLLIFL
jgi:WD40 repeat protein